MPVQRGDGLIEPAGLVVADEFLERGGQLGAVGVGRARAGNWHLLGQRGGLAGVAQRTAVVVEHRHRRVEAGQRGQHAIHPRFAVGFHPQRVTVEDQRGPDPQHAVVGDVFDPPRRLLAVNPVVDPVERALDPGRIVDSHAGLADCQRVALGVDQCRRREPAAQLGHQCHRVGLVIEQLDQHGTLVQRDRLDPAEEHHGVPGGHRARADQLPGSQLAAGRPLMHLMGVAGAYVAHDHALARLHVLDLEHRPLHEQPLLGKQPLVVG
ncbi:Uncharacterised protein [Mycobacterium tuberculosis]|uniref:Uncharacterized protein n=2 Tax=Mycobacterium tuberculosis TaxID=1773 RepID=A0A655ABU3_MYCTX|nr:hypothetical protein FF22_03495 [Mycobacterium tuberculosis]CFH21483.1 Uncharacterised protein [Mycobacterium tuberculosis]CFR43165.1 Uncharacterised protein [Mycobacterium tuberculosis]CFR71667.1 Uncharacterised protein [Mycobacterium tuberculosis]CFS15544.1 Uncharacterised protein [Mycobacterium tuberculosis]